MGNTLMTVKNIMKDDDILAQLILISSYHILPMPRTNIFGRTPINSIQNSYLNHNTHQLGILVYSNINKNI